MEKVKKRNKIIIIISSAIAIFIVGIFIAAMLLDADFSTRTKRDAERVYYAIDIVCLKNKDYANITKEGLIVSDLNVFENRLSEELQFDVEVTINHVPQTINKNTVCFKGTYGKGFYTLTEFIYYNGTYNWKSYSMKINPIDFSSYIS